MNLRSWIAAAGLTSVLASSSPAQSLLPPVAATIPSTPAMPPIGNAMSLDGVIATVLSADPKLRVGQEEIQQAVGEAITASLRPNPSLGVDTQLQPLTRPFTVAQQGGPPQFDTTLTYPIDWFLFGKRKAKMAAADLGVRQTESEYYDLVRRRIREASVFYFDVLETKALRDVARQDVANFEAVEAMTKRGVENGARPTVDLQRIQLDLLRSRQLLRDAEVAFANAGVRLRSLMGPDAPASIEVGGSLDSLAPETLPDLNAAFAEAEENRPDLAAMRYKIARSEAETVLEKRKAYPDLSAFAGYSRQFQGSIGYRDADTYAVGIDVTLPIFDRNQGNRAKAAAKLSQSQFEYQTGLVEVRTEIEQALNDYRVAVASSQAIAGEQLRLAEQVRDSINKAHEAGGRPLLDVLDAQRNYRETYRQFITSRANLGRAAVRLNAALGKKIIP